MSGLSYSAAYNPASNRQPQGQLDKGKFFEDRERVHAKSKESSKISYIIPDEQFDQIMTRYSTDLPSFKDAERAVNRIFKKHPMLKPIINSIKNSNFCEYFDYPSQLLFVGPSGCGKTHAAKALAKYCNKDCIFIAGSQIGNTYQNSGATQINALFDGILERSDKGFIVIIDEFMPVARFIDDDKNAQQNNTATALWKSLDRCAERRNVCVIGTDNGDPEKLTEALKMRFSYDIFMFRHMEQDDILEVIEECLSRNVYGTLPAYRAGFLNQFTQSVKHLSIRQIKKLIDRAKMLAVTEIEDPTAIATEDHLMRVLDIYRDPTWLQKVWMDRDKHVGNLTSARAVSIYMFIGGLGLSPQNYKYGGVLMGLGGIVNAVWADGKDLQLFGLMNNLSAQNESRRQWEASHAFNVKNSEEAKVARVDDVDRAKEHLGYARNADERGKEQIEQAKWDRIIRLKESIKQAEFELEITAALRAKKVLSDHIASFQEELYTLKPDERPKPVEPKPAEKGFFGW